jgi:integrase
LHPDVYYKALQRFLKRHKLRRVSFHELRHTHASQLVSNGTGVADVASRLGHSDIATTLKYYVHPLPEKQNEIAAQLEKQYGEIIKDD